MNYDIQKLDISMFLLAERLKEIQLHSYGTFIDNDIQCLINKIEDKIYLKSNRFKDYDIHKEEYYLKTYYEKPKFMEQ